MKPVCCDSRGRVLLGSKFAGKLFIIEESEKSIILRPAVVLPADQVVKD